MTQATADAGRTVSDQLRALWREVDALGGSFSNEYDAGYCQGVTQACVKLENAGFTEGNSAAADLIDQLVGAAKIALNYISNTESEFGITLCCAEALRAALATAKTGGAE